MSKPIATAPRANVARTHAALLVFVSLVACVAAPPPSAGRPPTAQPSRPSTPISTVQPARGVRVLGRASATLGEDARLQPQAMGDRLATLTRTQYGSFDAGAVRYFYARFNVHNDTNAPFQNLTFYAQHVKGPAAETVSLAGTAFKDVQNAGGGAITDAGVLQAITPSQRVQLQGANLVQVDSDADFQAVTPAEAEAVLGEGLSRGVLNPFDQVLEYAFVARNAQGGRTIPAGGDGQVTLTFRVPVQSDPALMPRGFTINMVIADVAVGRVTRGDLETTAQAQTRAAAIGGISELALVGTDDAVAGYTKIYRPALTLRYDAAAQPTRDPWLQPFNRRSIWNMPLGQNANIQSLGAFNPSVAFPTGFSGFGSDTELHFQLHAGDPLRDLYDPKSWTQRCGGTTRESPTFQMRVPDDWLIADAVNTPTEYSTPNNVSAFLQPDRDTVFELEPLARCAGDLNVYGYRNLEHPQASIRLDTGNYGTHFGSGLSGYGGSLRHGDLTSSTPIGHALHFNVWGKKFLNFNAATSTPGYRWPADRADNGAGSGDNAYGGTNPMIEQGALLAIPATTTLSMKTAAGAKMLQALRDYGAYITDDTGWAHYDWGVSAEALGEFREVYGYGFEQGAGATGAAKDWYDDVVALIAALGVVDDNAPDNIGGAGPRRRAMVTAEYAPFDADAPTVPGTPTLVSASVASLTVSWTPSSDAHRVTRYEVLGSGGQTLATTYGATTVTVSNLTPGTAYAVRVRAADGNGNLSAPSSALQASTKAGYAENFNAGTAVGWTLSPKSSVAGGVLNQGDWCCAGEFSVYGAGVTSGSYTLETDFTAFGTAVSNEAWIYFNVQDSNNYYALRTNGGPGNNTTLVKAVAGSVTALGSTAYSFTSGARVRVVYDTVAQRITVSSTRDGVTTPLFDVIDATYNGGAFGFGSAYNKVRVDNLTLEGSLGVARYFAQNFDAGSAPGWTLSAGSGVEYGHLKTGSFGASDSSFHPGPDGETYTFSLDLQAYGGGFYNEGYVYFNATDAANAYALHFNGSRDASANALAPKLVELLKIVGGSSTVLATFTAGYDFQSASSRVKIGYDAVNKRIVVQARTASGVTQSLFDVTDATYSGGQVGFGSKYNAVIADNVEVKAGLDLAVPVFTSAFDSSDPSWTLAGQNTFEYGRLRVGAWGGLSSATHAGTTGGSYAFSSDLFSYASGATNSNFLYFNFQDADNTYVVEMTSQTANTLTFKKRVGGVETTLATAGVSYPIQGDSNTARFTVAFDAAAHTFTITATRAGTTTTLFNAVYDTTFSAGQVGFGALYSQLDVDNVSLSQ
jgi:chitodextrinase